MENNNDKYHYLQCSAKAAMYLCLQQKPTGKFIYERDNEGKILTGKYNMLRHAGCVWMGSKILSPTPFLAARKFLIRRLEKEESGAIYLNCGNFKEPVYKLGGQAFAILALKDELSPYQLWGLKTGMYSFVDSQLKPSHFKRVNSKIDSFESEYYTGEAIMALASINDFMDAIQMIGSNDPAPHDHWYLMGLAEIGLKIPKKGVEYLERGRVIVDQIMSEPEKYEGNGCRIACRLEGVISWYKLYQSYVTGTVYKAYMDWIIHYIHVLLKYQNHLGGFIVNNTYRIDYTQHAAHALYLYSKL